ncbi:MAG: type II/IV secretion system protein [Planctomycetes bacterium]|nr:type II/IV secretion system protein [Planctomycetota bacterium]MBM4064395.1 type II/IV secretion system protein [Planctomycetota bacterium]
MKNSAHLIEHALLNKIINREQLDKAKELQGKKSIGLEDALVQLGYSTYQEIIKCLSEHYDLPILDITNLEIPEEVINLLPMQIIKKNGILPVSKNNGVIIVAMSRPPDLGFMDNLRFMLGSDIKCTLATSEQIKYALRRNTRNESTEMVGSLMKEIRTADIPVIQTEGESEGAYQTEAKSMEDDSPIIQLVSLIINKAIIARASDIHVEPLLSKLRIRYRIDGVCQESDVLPKNLQDPIISRIKILANIDISEKRRPQDGRISLHFSGRDMDIRVACLPSIYGESVVMRLLEKSQALMDIKNLGFCESDFQRFQSIIKRPNGIFLITGPTGSGKTTTLYAIINELNQTGVKIVTAEDPVEYTIKGVNQSEVNEKIGFSFPNILRTMLRQDPNVILVGEIRDTETADIAITSALTGHFVLSTLHTNDAPSAITRLLDMNIKPFLVSTSLQGIMAQRLVRAICKDCKERVYYTPEQIVQMGLDAGMFTDYSFYKGKGCKKCNNIGYKGRIGIYELMDMDETLRDMTYNVASTDEMRKAAKASGMTTLKEDGIRKAKEGKTTLEEIFRVTGVEE